MEPRFRRVQPSAPPAQATRRVTPAMPVDLDDDGELGGSSRRGRFGAPRNPWWKPQGRLGRVLLVAAAVALLGLTAYAWHTTKSFFEHDGRYRIAGTGNIQATGLTEVSRAEMLPVFGEDIGRNIFFVPLSERRKQLEQIPWVQHATVMRLLPDQIRVSVVERQPVAFVRHGQQIGLVDASGVLLEMPAAEMARHHYSFPVLTGIDAGDPLPSRRARMDVYGRMIGELDAGGQHLSNQISEIDLTDPEDARVLMPEQGADIMAHFGEDHFLDRYQRYKAHIDEWRGQYPKLAEVDLRYDQQVVLEMQKGAATQQAAVNDAGGKPMAAAPSLTPLTDSGAAAKPEAAKVATEEKPAHKLDIAKSETPKAVTQKASAPKTMASVNRPVGTKPAGTKSAKTQTAKDTKAQKAKEERAKLLAAKMRAKRKQAEMHRAALNNHNKKTGAKPHASQTAGQGQ